MDSDTKRRYLDHRAVLLEEGLTTGRSPAPRFNWFLYSVGFVFLVFMFAVVARQQLRISAMEERLAELQRDLFEDDIPFRDAVVYSSNGTGTAIPSRSRRQSGASRLTTTPLAHLRGELTEGRFPTGTSQPYLWKDAGSNPRTSDSGWRTNVCTIRSTSHPVYVQAISVSVEGWYYVYAQLPYMSSDYENPVGHKIVVIPNHGRSRPRDVLATSSTLPPCPDCEFAPRNWQYLGGLAYLSSGAHVEVRPFIDVESGEELLTADSAGAGGAFFGLFLVMENNQYGHRPIDSEC